MGMGLFGVQHGEISDSHFQHSHLSSNLTYPHLHSWKDSHDYCSKAEEAAWVDPRPKLRLEIREFLAELDS